MVMALPLCVSATPANKKALGKYLGDLLPPSLDTCATCHVRAHAEGAETLEDFPHNPFGKTLASLGEDVDLPTRLHRLADQDSDKDGVNDLDELLAGTFPGQAQDQPSQEQLAGLEERHLAFEAYSKRYAWKPFVPVQRPEVPEVANSTWANNPIDAFVAQQHASRGLEPRPEAPPHVLLRRVYLDLIGLSPRPEEIEAFETAYAKDPEAAYGAVLDRLLADPGYGERWGRHWMDVWRYSDWSGYKDALRDSQRHIWHWRDWIIEALNEDKPYDRMIVEMLAADELAPEDAKALRATGYLARNYYSTSRDQWLDNVVKHTSQAFMGVTMGCVRCHDHMYDPFPQEDYYAMRAIFEPYQVRTDRVPGELDRMKNGIPRVYDASLSTKTYLFERGDERNPVKDQPIEPAVPKALGGSFEIQPVSLSALAYQPDKRPFVKQNMMAEASDAVEEAKHALEVKAAEAALKALESVLEIEKLEDSGAKDSDEWKEAAKETLQLQREAKLAEATWKVTAAKLAQDKGTAALTKAQEAKDSAAETRAKKTIADAKKDLAAAEKLLTEAQKAAQEALTTKYEPRKLDKYPNQSTGRRLAFANWLTREENPLTARVAMNQIWMRHFGQPIVPTVAEFGANGREPTHPALLDWLAAEFMEQGWSMKAMHRLICSSATYRMASTSDPENLVKDPDNLFLWRRPSRRMEGELVRDNVLWVAGTLDRSMGGPDIDNEEAQTSKRRSIYFRHAHEKLVEFVQIFDGPKVNECYMREESVQPHQALALANSQLTNDQVKVLTGKLTEEAESTDALVQQAFLHVLARTPNPQELTTCRQFVESSPVDSRERAYQNLLLVLFNHNDFVTIR